FSVLCPLSSVLCPSHLWPPICVSQQVGVARPSKRKSRPSMSPSFILAVALSAPPAAPPPAVAALTHQLSSSNAITRSRAARELGALKEQAGAAVPHLARALADADPFVARDAAEALGRIGPVATPAL